MSKGKVGGSMSMEYDPKRQKLIRKRMARQEERWASRSGQPVTRKMTAEEVGMRLFGEAV